MRYFLLSAFLLLFLQGSLVGQSVPDSIPYNKPFIKLKSGEFYAGNDVHIEGDQVLLDGKAFDLRKIRFYNTKDDLHGRYRNLFLAVVYREKKINFFEGREVYRGGNSFYSVKTEYYYSRGIEKVRKVNIRNLVRDLTDDPAAYKEIKTANSLRIISNISMVAALPAFILPFILTGGMPPAVYFAIPGALAVNWMVCGSLKKRKMGKALVLYAPDLPVYQPKLFSSSILKMIK
jgi:hypothetical protein